MSSFSRVFRRSIVAVAAVSVGSVSNNFYEKVKPSKSLDTCSSSEQLTSTFYWPNETNSSHSSVSNTNQASFSNNLYSSVASSAFQLNSYLSAELAKFRNPSSFSDTLYRWHLPEPSVIELSQHSECASLKSKTVVVLLGWLGAKQKHLRRYADWYTSRGFHVITFTFPMTEILNYRVGKKSDQHIDSLVNHLSDWLEEEQGKNVVFHTFSNTGWLTYGAILEKFQKEDDTLKERIRGCIVDSAPVAAPDPQQSISTQGYVTTNGEMSEYAVETEPELPEAALLLILEKFFDVVLNLPSVSRRLSTVMGQLQSGQPSCPQLYIYSSADKVIPADSVESFIEEQQKTGREVRSCNFISTPHVDHFRNDPDLYTSQLTQFLDDCVLTCCKSS